MKLCPQCDFIYEDDQTLCDMDGRELVYHSGSVALEANSPSALTQAQENPWAAESLSVSGTPLQAVRSETKSEPKPEKKLGKKSKKKSTGTSARKRTTLVAAAIVLGVLVFMGYYISSRTHTSQAEAPDSSVTSPSNLSAAPAPSVATDSTAAVNPSAQELAQGASEAAAANLGDAPDENLDQTKTPNTDISSSHSRNLKPAATSQESSASRVRELASNRLKPENNGPPKDANVGRHEPVIVPKEPASNRSPAPIAQNQPKVVKPEDPKAKKESKVSSFFKKAGRMLKKSF